MMVMVEPSVRSIWLQTCTKILRTPLSSLVVNSKRQLKVIIFLNFIYFCWVDIFQGSLTHFVFFFFGFFVSFDYFLLWLLGFNLFVVFFLGSPSLIVVEINLFCFVCFVCFLFWFVLFRFGWLFYFILFLGWHQLIDKMNVCFVVFFNFTFEKMFITSSIKRVGFLCLILFLNFRKKKNRTNQKSNERIKIKRIKIKQIKKSNEWTKIERIKNQMNKNRTNKNRTNERMDIYLFLKGASLYFFFLIFLFL